MFEPVSGLVGLGMSYAGILGASRRNTSVSTEGAYVSQAASAAMEWRERSLSLFGTRASAIARIWNVAQECAAADWDGAGALAIDPAAALLATSIIRALPEDVDLPEVAPEPDGALSLDWVQSSRRLISISAGQTDRIAFAWLDGTNSGHGVERFDGVSLPPRIVSEIRSVLASAAVRAA